MRFMRAAQPEAKKASSFVLCCADLRKPAQHNRREYNYFSTLWLPSFCCSPFSGRCGKVSGVRVFAGSPCQMAVVKTLWGYLVGEIAGKLVSQLMRL